MKTVKISKIGMLKTLITLNLFNYNKRDFQLIIKK